MSIEDDVALLERVPTLRLLGSASLRMLEGFPDAAQRLRDLLASRTDQWATEMQNVHAALTRDAGAEPE